MPIRITDEIFADAIKDGVSINSVLSAKYFGEIADKKKENPALANASPVHFAMHDAGLTYNSPISAFYSTKENQYLFPAILETRIIEVVDNSPILNALIADTRTVTSKDVHTLIVDFTTDAAKKALAKRDVAEGADLARIKIGESEKTIRIFKRGLAVESTYEAIQDSTVEMFLATISEVMRFSAYQQIGDVIEVLVNGDGNDNPADSTATTETTGKVMPDDMTDFLIDFTDASDGLSANTLLVNKPIYKQLAKMYVPTNEANMYRPGTMFTFPQTVFDGLTVIYDKRVPQIGNKDIIIGIDKAAAVDKYVVANSIINEFDRNIVAQKQIGTISERTGFGKRNNKATRILKLK